MDRRVRLRPLVDAPVEDAGRLVAEGTGVLRSCLTCGNGGVRAVVPDRRAGIVAFGLTDAVDLMAGTCALVAAGVGRDVFLGIRMVSA